MSDRRGRSFSVRYKKYFRDFKHANGKSKFSQRSLDYGHSVGPIKNIIEVLHVVKKDGLMNTLEKFHICNVTRSDNQTNDKCTTKPNLLCELNI